MKKRRFCISAWAAVELTSQDGGYAWQAEGDNHGFTREIGQGFYYFEAYF